MKKILAVVLLLFLSACNGNNALETLKKEYPKTVNETAEQLPKNIQKEIIAPTKLPFKAENVSLEVQKNEVDDVINMTSLKFANGKGVILYVSTYHNKKTSFYPEDQQLKTTKLKDGTKAFIENDKETSKSIRWKKDGLYHSVSIIKLPEIEKEYTIQDLVKIADSMYEYKKVQY